VRALPTPLPGPPALAAASARVAAVRRRTRGTEEEVRAGPGGRAGLPIRCADESFTISKTARTVTSQLHGAGGRATAAPPSSCCQCVTLARHACVVPRLFPDEQIQASLTKALAGGWASVGASVPKGFNLIAAAATPIGDKAGSVTVRAAGGWLAGRFLGRFKWAEAMCLAQRAFLCVCTPLARHAGLSGEHAARGRHPRLAHLSLSQGRRSGFQAQRPPGSTSGPAPARSHARGSFPGVTRATRQHASTELTSKPSA
jgi:hypothetical protein